MHSILMSGCPDQRGKQGDDDGWEAVDEPSERFGFQVKKNTLTGAKPKETPKALIPPGHVRLQGPELMAALPTMTKEEKRLCRLLSRMRKTRTSRNEDSCTKI